MEPHTGLNNLDYIVLGILLLSGIFALFRGFVREICSLGAWTGAYFIAAKFYPLAEPWVHHHIPKIKEGAGIAAAILVYVVAFILLSIVGAIIVRMTVKGQALTAIDRSLGFIFGVLRGGLIVCILYMAVVAIVWPTLEVPKDQQPNEKEATSTAPEWFLQAKTRPFISTGATILKAFIPEKSIEKSTQGYMDEQATMKRMIDQKALDMLSTPTTATTKDSTAPTYDEKSRDNLDQLINEKGKP